MLDGLRSIERLDAELARQDPLADVTLRIQRDAVVHNAYGTASIEGNPRSLAEVQSLLAHGPTPDKVTVPGEKEFHLYAQVLNHLDDVAVPRTVDELLALHRRLFTGVLPKPGALKAQANFIGDKESRTVIFVPTPPSRTRKELREVLAWYHTATEHPIIKAGILFHELQSIHPFADGNGRLGRALLALALWHAGYRGVRFAVVDYAFNRDRRNYYAAIQDARTEDDFGLWVSYLVSILRESFRGAVHRFLFAGALLGGWNDRTVRVAEAAARLDADNRGRRFKLADMHALLPQVPQRTLQLDLSRLVQANILERKGDRKATSYRFVFRPEEPKSNADPPL